MTRIPFHVAGDDDGHFYAVATCDGIYITGGGREAATIVLYASPSRAFSRFSFHIFSSGGEWRMYQAGPDHSSSVDAALLDGWISFGVPAYAWSLLPRDALAGFVDPTHQHVYVEARSELCRVLYTARMKAWSQQHFGAAPFFAPPDGGYTVPDAMAATAENEELLESASAMKTDDRQP